MPSDKDYFGVYAVLYPVTGISLVSIVVAYLRPNVLSTPTVVVRGRQVLLTTVEGEGTTGGSTLVG